MPREFFVYLIIFIMSTLKSESIARFPDDPSIVRLVTNPDQQHQFEGIMTVEESLEAHLHTARKNVRSAAKGAMAGTPLAPHLAQHAFVANGFYVLEKGQKLFKEDPDALAHDMLAHFDDLSTGRTGVRADMDPVHVLASLDRMDGESPDTQGLMDEFQNRYGNFALNKGLMVFGMHPSRDYIPRTQSSFMSRAPMLVVRRLHMADGAFMKTRAQKRAYARHFNTSL